MNDAERVGAGEVGRPDPGRNGGDDPSDRARPADYAFGFRTRAVHAGGRPDPTTGARAVPIYQTTSFVFEDALDASSLFALQKFGNIYSRIANPTVAAFEERVASLEGGLGAIGTSSGQAAELLVFIALAGAGDHIVASSRLYGGTRTLLDVTLRRLGLDTTFVDGDDPADFAAAVTPATKALYTEVIGNPSGAISDLAGLADVAHAHDVPLVVDATLATPYLCRPIEHGADIVVHSATKFIGGHGTSIGGVVVESGRFDWANGRFPLMTEPVASYGGLSWWGNFAEYGFLTRLRAEQLRDVGATMTPFNAFLFLLGLETLPLRMAAHVENAATVAEFLDGHPAVAWVAYAGLAASPWHERAKRYLPAGPGAVFSFGVVGGRAAGQRFIEGVELASHLANVGDAKTLVIHPASTTHAQLDDAALAGAGVSPELIRISVGIEDAEDICRDLDRALRIATA
jgi:O-acetylhomoserine (thiol)-lyase